MARATSHRTIAAATLATVVLLTGCSGSEDPAGPASPSPSKSPTEASASPSPSPSASPAIVKPERPAAMQKQDAEGAAAAAEYFLALYNYTKDSGDTSEWEAMSHDACQFCRNVLERATEIQENDLDIEGGDISAKVVEIYQRDEVTGIYPLDVNVKQERSTTTRANGTVESTSEVQDGVMRVEVGVRDNSWVVVTVAPKPSR